MQKPIDAFKDLDNLSKDAHNSAKDEYQRDETFRTAEFTKHIGTNSAINRNQMEAPGTYRGRGDIASVDVKVATVKTSQPSASSATKNSSFGSRNRLGIRGRSKKPNKH